LVPCPGSELKGETARRTRIMRKRIGRGLKCWVMSGGEEKEKMKTYHGY
jgi:hypothetical protein